MVTRLRSRSDEIGATPQIAEHHFVGELHELRRDSGQGVGLALARGRLRRGHGQARADGAQRLGVDLSRGVHLVVGVERRDRAGPPAVDRQVSQESGGLGRLQTVVQRTTQVARQRRRLARAINAVIVTRLRSRGERSGRLQTSPYSTSSVSAAMPGATFCCSGPEGRPAPAAGSPTEARLGGLRRRWAGLAGIRQRTVVLLVAHLLHPLHGRAVTVLGDGDVRHRRLRRRPVPVLLAGRDPHHVPRTDLLDGVAPSLHASGARRDDQDLAARMRVPRRAGAGLERHGCRRWRATGRPPRTASRPARCR